MIPSSNDFQLTGLKEQATVPHEKGQALPRNLSELISGNAAAPIVRPKRFQESSKKFLLHLKATINPF